MRRNRGDGRKTNTEAGYVVDLKSASTGNGEGEVIFGATKCFFDGDDSC